MNASESMRPAHTERYDRSAGLVEILDRVLDKGLVVAGDIKVSLAEVELLTISIRLLICSLDKAEQLGIDWWKFDRRLSPGRQVRSAQSDQLRKEVKALELQVASLTRQALRAGVKLRASRARRPAHKRTAQGVTHGN
jgi:Gas vesicle protein